MLPVLREPELQGWTLLPGQRVEELENMQTPFHRLTCSLRETSGQRFSRVWCPRGCGTCSTPHQDSAFHCAEKDVSMQFPEFSFQLGGSITIRSGVAYLKPLLLTALLGKPSVQ